jgi:hypothetical protein
MNSENIDKRLLLFNTPVGNSYYIYPLNSKPYFIYNSNNIPVEVPLSSNIVADGLDMIPPPLLRQKYYLMLSDGVFVLGNGNKNSSRIFHLKDNISTVNGILKDNSNNKQIISTKEYIGIEL